MAGVSHKERSGPAKKYWLWWSWQ